MTSSGSMNTHRMEAQKHRESRARRVLFRKVSKVSKVSKGIKTSNPVSHLGLDTWRLQVSKIRNQVSKTPQPSG
jgi:hypothetical protein